MSYRHRAVEYLELCRATVSPGKFHSIGDKYFTCSWDGTINIGEIDGVWKSLTSEEFIQLLIDYYIKEDLTKLMN